MLLGRRRLREGEARRWEVIARRCIVMLGVRIGRVQPRPCRRALARMSSPSSFNRHSIPNHQPLALVRFQFRRRKLTPVRRSSPLRPIRPRSCCTNTRCAWPGQMRCPLAPTVVHAATLSRTSRRSQRVLSHVHLNGLLLPYYLPPPRLSHPRHEAMLWQPSYLSHVPHAVLSHTHTRSTSVVI